MNYDDRPLFFSILCPPYSGMWISSSISKEPPVMDDCDQVEHIFKLKVKLQDQELSTPSPPQTRKKFTMMVRLCFSGPADDVQWVVSEPTVQVRSADGIWELHIAIKINGRDVWQLSVNLSKGTCELQFSKVEREQLLDRTGASALPNVAEAPIVRRQEEAESSTRNSESPPKLGTPQSPSKQLNSSPEEVDSEHRVCEICGLQYIPKSKLDHCYYG